MRKYWGLGSVAAAAMFVGLLSLGSGCAHGPSPTEAAAADYGTPIAQAEAERLAEQFMARILKDPASATYEWGRIETGYIEAAPILRQKLTFGYRLEASINSKNSYGGYTGRKKYQFMYRNGSLIAVMGEEQLGSGGTYMRRIL